MKSKNVSILLIFTIVSLIVISCGTCNNQANTKANKKNITVNIECDPSSLDPRKARLLTDFNIIKTLNEGLYRINKKGKTTEAIAESSHSLDDGSTYVVKLKRTQWSNGDPVTAHDFIYAWKSSLKKDFPSPSSYFLFCIKNAKLVKEGLLPISMLGVHAQGDYTIVLELEKPIPYLDKLLSLPIFFPVHEGIDKENPNWANGGENYICNGPFKLNSWKHKNEIIVEKNFRYWDKDEVKLKRLSLIMVDQETAFSMYQNEEVDFIGSPYSQIPIDAVSHMQNNTILKKNPFLGTYWIRTNTNTYPLSEKNFRKSLAMSINRSDLVNHTLSGGATIATGIVPKSMGLQPSPYFRDGDSKAAENLLISACEALKIHRKEIPKLSLIFTSTGNNRKIAAVIQNQWKKNLGIEVQLEPLEYKVYLNRIQTGDYDLSCGSWIADFEDPINFLEVFKNKQIGTNNTGWEDPNYTKSIESSYQMDREDRLATLQASEKLLMDDMPVIPIYHYTMMHMKSDHLKDVILSQTGTIDFKWAYIEDL